MTENKKVDAQQVGAVLTALVAFWQWLRGRRRERREDKE